MDDQPLSLDGTALFGRERELGALRDALAAALAGRGSLVLIGGEAGIGKTALAEATLAEAEQRGALALVGRCYDLSETPPYGPWREALGRAPRESELPPPLDLVGSGVTSQAALFAAVREYLAALAAHRPLVLLLDDLHWADQASLDLLRFVARQLHDLPLLIAATYRTDELTRRHALYQLLPVLVREARAARIDLRPLDANGLRALVAARHPLPPGDEARLVAYLRGRAEGNPFFAGELLRALEEAAILRRAEGTWHLGDLGGAAVPPLLRQVLDARIDRLGEAARDLLAVAAVLGQEVALDLWATVANTAEVALLPVIERAVAAHLLLEAGDGATVRFAHALVREALYEGTLAVRRRTLHRRAAEALTATPAPDPDAVALHFQRAGDPRAAEWLVRAGERAQDAYAWVIAAARFAAALEAADPVSLSAGERGWLLLRLGLLWRYADQARALAYLRAAREAADAAGDAGLAARARHAEGHLLCFAGELARGLGALEAGVAALDAALATTPAGTHPPPPWVERDPDHHRGLLANWLAQSGHFARARALGEAVAARGAVPTTRGALDPAAATDAWFALGLVHAAGGRPEEARRAFARYQEANQARGHHIEVGTTMRDELCWAVLAYQADRLAERRALAEEAGRAYGRAAGVLRGFVAAEVLLPLLAVEGRWAEARRAAEEVWANTSWQKHLANTGTTLAPLARAQGEAGRAWAVVRAVIPGAPQAAPEALEFLTSLALLRAGAALATDAADLGTARTWLAAHDHWLAWSGAVLGRAEGALGWAAYHRAAGDLDAAREHAERALAHATEPRQPLALLAAHRILGELDMPTGRHTDAAQHLDAALALADACAAPYERALTLLVIAELCAAEGNVSEATRLITEARATFTALGARPALARAEVLAARLADAALAAPVRGATPPFGLTPREAEILRLVAQGLGNLAIADRLSLSRRTVEQHLRSVYDKLGVENRAAATRLAVERGLA